MNESTKLDIEKFIKDRNVMVIGVADQDEPYTCTAWYVTANAHALYFKSRTASVHSRVLLRNPKAAIAIYDHQSTYSSKAGIQAVGVVERVRDMTEIVHVVKMYGDAFQGAGEKLQSLPDLIGEYVKSAMYKLTINKIKMVDSSMDILLTEYEDW